MNQLIKSDNIYEGNFKFSIPMELKVKDRIIEYENKIIELIKEFKNKEFLFLGIKCDNSVFNSEKDTEDYNVYLAFKKI